MSEHKSNPAAILHSMLPELLPHGHAVGVQLPIEVVPAAGVLLYPAEHMRKVDEAFEVQPFQAATVDPLATPMSGVTAEKWGDWQPPPAGVRVVHPIGQPLPPELCDVVMMFGTSVQDGMSGGLVTAGGQAARYRTSHVMHGELMRMPLVEWQKQHLVQLRGQVA